MLARHDVEVNNAVQNKPTALMVASQQGHVEVVRLLLAHPDVKANRTLSDGRSALCVASQSGHGAIVSLLLSLTALTGRCGCRPLTQSTRCLPH